MEVWKRNKKNNIRYVYVWMLMKMGVPKTILMVNK